MVSKSIIQKKYQFFPCQFNRRLTIFWRIQRTQHDKTWRNVAWNVFKRIDTASSNPLLVYIYSERYLYLLKWAYKLNHTKNKSTYLCTCIRLCTYLVDFLLCLDGMAVNSRCFIYLFISKIWNYLSELNYKLPTT